eukprot:m.48775 g.48775  ORF g.48775 m.48775 type:complete len:148 (-) comp10854_c0_seq2:2075-2518(-)
MFRSIFITCVCDMGTHTHTNTPAHTFTRFHQCFLFCISSFLHSPLYLLFSSISPIVFPFFCAFVSVFVLYNIFHFHFLFPFPFPFPSLWFVPTHNLSDIIKKRICDVFLAMFKLCKFLPFLTVVFAHCVSLYVCGGCGIKLLCFGNE